MNPYALDMSNSRFGQPPYGVGVADWTCLLLRLLETYKEIVNIAEYFWDLNLIEST